VADVIEQSRIELTDPRALRAYAHPTRLALVGLLRREGPKTATQAAAAIGESVASCSFHLRQLAKYGLIEEVEGRHGRAKPWRATALFTTWPGEDAGPETLAAAAALDQVIIDRYHARTREWLARRDRDTPAWRRAAGFSDYLLHLTAPELRRLTDAIEELASAYLPRLQDPSLRPKGSRPVALIHIAHPTDETDAS
jgi:DNA-binding transcriptional ArsR family regulator